MATLSAPPHSFTSSDNTSNQRDPFWQSTPRTSPQGIADLMAAVQHVVPTSKKTRPNASTSLNSAPRRPQCTHITMDRIYGDHCCHMCGKVSNLGWVYACKQDDLQSKLSVSEPEALPVVPDSGNYFESQAKVAELLGMSKSVISQMRAGEYNFDQIETLLEQRRHVVEVIKAAESDTSTPNTPALPSNPYTRNHLPFDAIIASVEATTAPAVRNVIVNSSLPMSPAGTPDNTPVESAANTPNANRKKVAKKQACNYQVCHACRPFFQDRLPMSCDSVLNNEIPAVTEEEIATKLPVLDSNVVCNWGLRESPKRSPDTTYSQDSMDITMRQGDAHEDDISADWTPTSGTVSESESDMPEGSDPYPCPGAGVCPVCSQDQGCAYDNGFDDGRRAVNHGFLTEQELHGLGIGSTSSTRSSISLPEISVSSITSDELSELAIPNNLGKSGRAATVCGVPSHDEKALLGQDSDSSLGSEVEVEGGVALTEEAVGSGVPDIATEYGV